MACSSDTPITVDLCPDHAQDTKLVKSLLAPYDGSKMQAWQISKRVNSPANDSP
jgi:putative SOS response-associated peptidase YedK